MVLADKAVNVLGSVVLAWEARAVETLHTSPVVSPLATRTWGVGDEVGGGVGEGEGVGVVLRCGEEVVEDEKAAGKPLMSVEASPGRHRAYTTCPRTSSFSSLRNR